MLFLRALVIMNHSAFVTSLLKKSWTLSNSLSFKHLSKSQSKSQESKVFHRVNNPFFASSLTSAAASITPFPNTLATLSRSLNVFTFKSSLSRHTCKAIIDFYFTEFVLESLKVNAALMTLCSVAWEHAESKALSASPAINLFVWPAFLIRLGTISSTLKSIPF